MLIRKDEASDVYVYVSTDAYWVNVRDRFTTGSTGLLPEWYQNLITYFFEHEDYNCGIEVPKQAIIDYIDEHHPDAVPQA